MDGEYYDDEAKQEEADEAIAEQFKEGIPLMIHINADIDRYIKSAIDRLVAEKTSSAIEQMVNSQVKTSFETALDAAIIKIVEVAIKTPIKKYDYAGHVIEEKSLEDKVRDISEDIAKQGSQYKLKWDIASYRTATGTISDLIAHHVKLIVGDRLKPQFEEIEKDFKEKSQAALRQFAVQAVDNATQKVLGGGR